MAKTWILKASAFPDESKGPRVGLAAAPPPPGPTHGLLQGSIGGIGGLVNPAIRDGMEMAHRSR